MEKENKNQNGPIEFDGNENNAPQRLIDLDVAKQRINELEAEVSQWKGKADTNGKYHLQYYRMSEILKKGVAKLMEAHNISRAEWLDCLMAGNDLDEGALLLMLSK